eukprot:GHVO01054005.1.p1 GENE.GHVO01054005.1~~GHVO01054005.1.p1  ORF type:complete len:238 (+),score=26.68 GHVO01054005.1:322-1035(+)
MFCRYRDAMKYYEESDSDDDWCFTPMPCPDAEKEHSTPLCISEAPIEQASPIRRKRSTRNKLPTPVSKSRRVDASPSPMKCSPIKSLDHLPPAPAEDEGVVPTMHAPTVLFSKKKINLDPSQGELSYPGVRFEGIRQAWRFKKQTKDYYFYIRDYGYEGAFLKAVELKSQMVEMKTKSTSNVTGVSYHTLKRSWKAEIGIAGKTFTKSFNVDVYGENEAFRLAVEHRRNLEKQRGRK